MEYTPLHGTDLRVSRLALGGNVFGWTASETDSRSVLDAYIEAGGNFIDTADSYSAWAPGNVGGESEEIIGRWLASRGNRDNLVLATKVGFHADASGLSSHSITRAIEASLRRLRTDRIDLYYAHRVDADIPLDETLHAFDRLVESGKVRYVGASNHEAPRVEEALGVSRALGLPQYNALQSEYNLVDRRVAESSLLPLAQRESLSFIAYGALAYGLLSGKYSKRTAADPSPRAAKALSRLNRRTESVLEALQVVAEDARVPMVGVAIAWLLAQPSVTAAIASARTIEQLREQLAGCDRRLEPEQIGLLTRVGGMA